MLSFFTLDVLDKLWDLTESVSEGFLTTLDFGYSQLLSRLTSEADVINVFEWRCSN